jgi:hypothetical protein
MIKRIVSVCLAVYLSLLCVAQGKLKRTELVVLGTVHFPTKSVNKDSIYSVMKRVGPDIILMELDSSFFTPDFKLKQLYDENEIQATDKYIKENPNCLIRPYDFEGRNQYRVEKGFSNADKVIRRLGVMYYTKKLNSTESGVWKNFQSLTDSIELVGKKGLDTINSIGTDLLVSERQFYQYRKIREIINSKEEFLNSFEVLSRGGTLTYREIFNRYAYFEELRNRVMVDNILKIIKENPGKRILVLTGFYHRDFMLTELKYKEVMYDFVIKAFNQ